MAPEDDLSAGTRDDVLARVGTDKGLAEAALAAEQKRDEGPRSTVVEALEWVLRGSDDDEQPGVQGEPDENEVTGPVIYEVQR